MADEAAFLAEIHASPGDPTPRLVYADWLEEHGDPRADLIRVEERMRQIPVYSDEFWQLKPRRNELRAQAAPDWLEEMHYGRDCQPTFRHGVPDGWKERWRLIREFTERWHWFPLGDVGGRGKEIREVETRLERALPPSVREWVAFAHDVRRQASFHDVLRDTYQMQELDGHSAISLLLQGEGDYHWAVRHADLALPDPPVYGFHWDFDNPDEDEIENTFVQDAANPIAPTVTAFVLQYVWGYTHGMGGFGTEVAETAKLMGDLEATFPVECWFGQTQIFEAENMLVRLDPSDRKSLRRLNVIVARSVPREAIPAFLWEYTHNGGSFHGMFISRHE